MVDIDKLLSEADIASKLGFSKFWLRDLRRRGEGPPYIRVGGRFFYAPEDVSGWLERHRTTPSSEERDNEQ